MSKLKELRDKRALTQQELATKAGISITTVSRLEKAKVKASLKTTRALAAAFDIGIEEMRQIIDTNG